MNKRDYFITALQAGAFTKTHWRNTCFIKRIEPENFWKRDPYHYRPVSTGRIWSYVDAEGVLEPIEGTDGSKPMYIYLDAITLNPGDFENQPKSLTTTYGNVLFNAMAVVSIFKDIIPFQTGRITSALEQLIVDRMVDDDAELKPGQIHAKQYVAFSRVISTFEEMAPMVSVAATPRNILPPAGLAKKKKELAAKYGDTLSDPAQAVKYENELRAFDDEWLKDDPSNGRLMSGKTKGTARLKLHLTRGSDPNFTEADQNDYTTDPLSTGLPKTRKGHAIKMSVIRNASYSRGSMTAKSGTDAKLINRILAHLSVLVGRDCGTDRVFNKLVTSANKKTLVGLNYMSGRSIITVTDKAVDGLVGKTLPFRSPLYCESSRAHVCSVCGGDRLSLFPKGLNLAGGELSGGLYSHYFSLAKSITHSNTTVDIRSSIS